MKSEMFLMGEKLNISTDPMAVHRCLLILSS